MAYSEYVAGRSNCSVGTQSGVTNSVPVVELVTYGVEHDVTFTAALRCEQMVRFSVLSGNCENAAAGMAYVEKGHAACVSEMESNSVSVKNKSVG